MIVIHLINGVKTACKQWRPVLLIYFIMALFTLPLGMQVLQVFDASIGDSLNMNLIEQGFNRTVFEDFLNVHGASITPLVGMIRWIIFMYLFISIFLHAGIYFNVIHGHSDIPSFFKGAVKNYFSFFLLSIFFLFIMLIWTIVIIAVISSFVGNPTEDLSSEKVFVWSIIVGIIIYLVGIFHIVLWGIFSKIQAIKYQSSFFVNIRTGITYLKNNWRRGISIAFIYLSIHVLVSTLYYLISDPIGSSYMLLIFGLILLQQITVLARIALRVGYYSSIFSLISR